jgi:hypothetical protein
MQPGEKGLTGFGSKHTVWGFNIDFVRLPRGEGRQLRESEALPEFAFILAACHEKLQLEGRFVAKTEIFCEMHTKMHSSDRGARLLGVDGHRLQERKRFWA